MQLPEEKFVSEVNDACNHEPKSNSIVDGVGSLLKSVVSVIQPGMFSSLQGVI